MLAGDLLLPPCLWQYGELRLIALVMQPSTWHVPLAPCLPQTPRAIANVVQPSVVHAFLLPPPCLLHVPFAADAAVVLQPPKEQNPKAPCFTQSPQALATAPHPAGRAGLPVIAANVALTAKEVKNKNLKIRIAVIIPLISIVHICTPFNWHHQSGNCASALSKQTNKQT